MNLRAAEVLELVGGGIDPEARVFVLPRTERRLLAITRGLVTNANLLELDERTASLPAADVERLFAVLRRLRGTGVGMIYVAHRLDESYEILTRTVVMRRGRVVVERLVAGLSQGELVGHFVGRHTEEMVFDPPEQVTRLERSPPNPGSFASTASRFCPAIRPPQ